MSKHNKGPWEAVRLQGGDYHIITEGLRGQLEVATVHREAEYGPLDAEANAALIAAAPEMLAALKLAFLSLTFKGSENRCAEVRKKIEAVVAKAEGKQDE